MHQLVVAVTAPTLKLCGCIFLSSGRNWECFFGPGGKVEFIWDLLAATGRETGRRGQKS